MDCLNKQGENLDEETYELYDRNIRLWGKENQMKFIQSNVILINLNSVITELAKNLVLAGVNLYLYDREGNGTSYLVTREDVKSNFFLDEDHLEFQRVNVLKIKIGSINSFVKVQELESLENLNNIHCACIGYKSQESTSNYEDIFSKENIPFFSIKSNNIHGLFYNNIIASHEKSPNLNNFKIDFRPFSFKDYLNILKTKIIDSKQKKSKKKISKDYVALIICIMEILLQKATLPDKTEIFKNTKIIEKYLNEVNLSFIINDEQFLKLFNPREFSPVQAILAGIVSQEILNVLTNPSIVHKGLYIYDAEEQFGEFL